MQALVVKCVLIFVCVAAAQNTMVSILYSRANLISLYHTRVYSGVRTALRKEGIAITATHRGVRGSSYKTKRETMCCGIVNCQSVRNKRDQLLKLIDTKHLDLVVLTETWLKSDETDMRIIKQLTLQNFDFHHKPWQAKHRGGGVGLLCNSKLSFKNAILRILLLSNCCLALSLLAILVFGYR